MLQNLLYRMIAVTFTSKTMTGLGKKPTFKGFRWAFRRNEDKNGNKNKYFGTIRLYPRISANVLSALFPFLFSFHKD